MRDDVGSSSSTAHSALRSLLVRVYANAVPVSAMRLDRKYGLADCLRSNQRPQSSDMMLRSTIAR